MRFYVVLRYASLTMPLCALFLIISGVIAAFHGTPDMLPLFYTAAFALLFGLLSIIFVPPIKNISNKEGTLVIVISWLLACLIGAVPFVLYGSPFTFTNAMFESVSGFTTTGSTIIQDIESLPLGLLFWRACTHWIGGIGIVIFVLSLLPFLGFSEVVLFRREISSLARESLQVRTRNALRVLVKVYVGLTVLETLLLKLAGMSLYDAITHSFATIATGGFSTHNASIAYFDSPLIEIIVMIFMILSGMPFILLYMMVTRRELSKLWKASVVRFYLGSLLIGIILTVLDLQRTGNGAFWTDLRVASFNLLSVGTSTGFANANTAIWPHTARMLLILFTLQCACAGSTSGGIKVDRIMLAIKRMIKHIHQIMRPRAVLPIKLNGNVVKDDFADHAVLYIAFYMLFVLSGTVLLTLMGVDLTEAFSGAAATMGNVGPGLGQVGSTGNFADIPAAGKWVLSSLMILGRLEIFAVILFFTPMQWSQMKSY